VGAAAGANLAGVLTELGGKAPMLIFADADIDQVQGVGRGKDCAYSWG
jgi:acyl-CoA reductase-like NAD-dependent aldehyde dehydrogenase